MKQTNQNIKVTNCASKKCVGKLNEIMGSMGELVVPMNISVLEETLEDILFSLPTMNQLRVHPYYYPMILKVHYGGDYEILNYKYEWCSGNTSEDRFRSDGADEGEQEVEESIKEFVLMLNKPEKRTENSGEDQMVDENISNMSKKDSSRSKDNQGPS